MKWFDKLLGREKLKQRNDALVAANNRLGKMILELRREKRPRTSSGKLKEIARREEALKIAKYEAHVQAQRQHLLVKMLSKHLAQEQFQRCCDEVNSLTDEQILARS